MQGIPVTSITLFLFGGVAAIDRESKTPVQAFQVAIAGPVVSLLIFAALWLGSQTFSATAPLHVLLLNLARINLILALFNLIPGLPLDGGQVFKSVIWGLTGDRLRGVVWAAKSGQILGVSAGISSLILAVLFPSQAVWFLWIGLIGGFVWRQSRSYQQVAYLQQVLLNLQVIDVLQPLENPATQVVESHLTVAQFIQHDLQQETPPDRYLLTQLMEQNRAKQ